MFATLPGADAVLDLGLKECSLHKLTYMHLKGKRNDDQRKTQFVKLWDRLAYPERTRKKCSPAKSQADSANWQGDIGKHCYAPMTPYKSF